MSPIRPDLPSPRHAATHPVATTTARVAQAAFFQQALAGVKAAQEAQQTQSAPRAEAPRAAPAAREADAMDRPRRPGSFLDITV
ncbi:hypothetical protein [Brevundimonas sp.]|uniref:hypothetical protein n=1 Tax=Brevundimonas sp. TaxID=1871086 RepID=UPI003918D19E